MSGKTRVCGCAPQGAGLETSTTPCLVLEGPRPGPSPPGRGPDAAETLQARELRRVFRQGPVTCGALGLAGELPRLQRLKCLRGVGQNGLSGPVPPCHLAASASGPTVHISAPTTSLAVLLGERYGDPSLLNLLCAPLLTSQWAALSPTGRSGPSLRPTPLSLFLSPWSIHKPWKPVPLKVA